MFETFGKALGTLVYPPWRDHGVTRHNTRH
jgi:hypothetical protein